MPDRAAPDVLLDWHQARRSGRAGIVTVLVGPAGIGVRTWRRWAAAAGRAVAQVVGVSPPDVARDWAAAALDGVDVVARAADWLRAAGGAAGDASPVPKTLHDLDRRWRRLPGDPAAPAAAVARHILSAAAVGRPYDPASLVADVAGGDPDAAAGAAGVRRSVRAAHARPGARPPAPSPPDADAATWLPAALRLLDAVAEAVPALPVAACVSAAGFAAVVPTGAAGRAAALARDGAVPVPEVTAGQLTARLRAAGVDPPPPAAALDRLTADGLADEVADAYVAAAVRRADPADAAAGFRSLPERFLHGQLELLPDTAGLFRPNRPLPFAHGPAAAVADLLCDRLKIVVEVDGAYYHLNQPQYRRDRRKDWLCQRHGYLVVRVLAEDVVDDLAAVVSAVREAVALRRAAGLPAEVPAGD